MSSKRSNLSADITAVVGALSGRAAGSTGNVVDIARFLGERDYAANERRIWEALRGYIEGGLGPPYIGIHRPHEWVVRYDGDWCDDSWLETVAQSEDHRRHIIHAHLDTPLPIIMSEKEELDMDDIVDRIRDRYDIPLTWKRFESVANEGVVRGSMCLIRTCDQYSLNARYFERIPPPYLRPGWHGQRPEYHRPDVSHPR